MSPVFFHLSLLNPFFPASLISLGPKTKAVQTAAWTEINKKKQKLFFIIYPRVSWQEGRWTGVLIDSRCAGPHSQLRVLFFQRDSFFLSAETKAGNIDAGYGSRHAAAACVCVCACGCKACFWCAEQNLADALSSGPPGSRDRSLPSCHH